MAFIVEDGTGLASAESYVSVSEADSYHELRGNTSWDSIDDKEALLRKATDYMQGKYGGHWAGYKKSTTQALDWPREEVLIKDRPSNYVVYYDNDSVPNAVKHACAILALRAYSNDLLADQGQRKVSVQVGPISTTYDTSSSPATRYLEVDNMLAPFFKTAGGIRMIRV